jgi:hypothetical protein
MRADVGIWLKEYGLLGDITYEWITGEISFGSEEDAMAFTLKFGINRHKIKVEEMIENERSLNVD